MPKPETKIGGEITPATVGVQEAPAASVSRETNNSFLDILWLAVQD
jgi:hypothetical protein